MSFCCLIFNWCVVAFWGGRDGYFHVRAQSSLLLKCMYSSCKLVFFFSLEPHPTLIVVIAIVVIVVVAVVIAVSIFVIRRKKCKFISIICGTFHIVKLIAFFWKTDWLMCFPYRQYTEMDISKLTFWNYDVFLACLSEHVFSQTQEKRLLRANGLISVTVNHIMYCFVFFEFKLPFWWWWWWWWWWWCFTEG